MLIAYDTVFAAHNIVIIINIASFSFRWASISCISKYCNNTIIQSCPASRRVIDAIAILFYSVLGVSLDVAETIAVCIINLWGCTEILIWNLNPKSEVLPTFLLFSAYKKYSMTTVVSLSLMPCTSFFPALYYSSVVLGSKYLWEHLCSEGSWRHSLRKYRAKKETKF